MEKILFSSKHDFLRFDSLLSESKTERKYFQNSYNIPFIFFWKDLSLIKFNL